MSNKYLEKQHIHRRHGDEPFIGMDSNLLEFWEWAHSDIMSNTERGRLAEFIVSKAVGARSDHRVEWDIYDVTTPDGITVEVKTSAYLQTWKQTRLSSIAFDIAPKKEWYDGLNHYSDTAKRSAQVYVFCLFAATEGLNANPLDLDQWEFYVLPTKILDTQVPFQKTITLPSLLKLGAHKSSFKELRTIIHTAVDP